MYKEPNLILCCADALVWGRSYRKPIIPFYPYTTARQDSSPTVQGDGLVTAQTSTPWLQEVVTYWHNWWRNNDLSFPCAGKAFEFESESVAEFLSKNNLTRTRSPE